MKVLFLDVDGVLNSRATTDFKNHLFPIDPYMSFLVGKIQLDTDCEIVLSSSWRLHPDGIEAVEKLLPLLDKTPYNGGIRGSEVKQWLKEHPEVTRYAILDDDSDFYKYQPLFQTTFENGLTPEIAKQVTDYLNKESK